MRTPARLFALLCGVILACLATACSPLPKDWPIAELTLPPGSKKAAAPRSARTIRELLNRIKGVEDYITINPKWEVGFDNEGGWDAVKSSVTSQLTALGYTQWQPKDMADADNQAKASVGGQTYVSLIQVYESPDKKLLVNLFNTGAMTMRANTIDHEGEFSLTIHPRN